MEKIGKRIVPFDYSRTVLLSISDFDKKINDEIRRVKGLKHGEKAGWVRKDESSRDKLFGEDSLMKLSKCGKVAYGKFKGVGLETIADLLKITEIQKSKLGSMKMSEENLEHFLKQARLADKHQRPKDTDFRLCDNPDLSRYGELWREIIEKTHYMKQFTCVTKMIDHIFEETRKVYLSTTHENDWMLYHDALSLMTARECRDYIRGKGYESHWILPEQDLFHDDPTLKAYRNRPVGNSPELCSLDSCLNKDIHEGVNRHIQLTSELKKEDARKFRIDTPLFGAKAYKRILDPTDSGVAPTSKRIIQDTEAVLNAIKMIIAAKGTVVPDINNRTGRRRDKGIHTSEWGGARKRKLGKNDYGRIGKIHIDAQSGIVIKLENSKKCFDAKPLKNKKTEKETNRFHI